MDKNVNPEISVLMPVYNCAAYIYRAIESILNQSFAHFELIIIDDASTDMTLNEINKFNDDRIVLIKKPSNTGYCNSLNLGLKLAKGDFIARMDGDDISCPKRFEKQIEYLKGNKNIIVCGTNYKILGTNINSQHPHDPRQLKVFLLSGCYIAHPSVMLRKNALLSNNIWYNPLLEPAEDYNLWVELLQLGEVGNLSESLLKYRIHSNQASQLRYSIQSNHADSARLKLLSALVPLNQLTARMKSIHLCLMTTRFNVKITRKDLRNWIDLLLQKNFSLNEFDQKELSSFLKIKEIEYNKSASKIKWKERTKKTSSYISRTIRNFTLTKNKSN